MNGKLREMLSTSRHKSEEQVTNNENDLTNIPIIKQTDNARLLPKYTTILAKPGDDGVSRDDLDHLQHDLERLLSTSAVRIRYLRTEIGEIDRNDDHHDRKGHDKPSLKRKRPDEKPKFKDLKNGFRGMKKSYGVPLNKFMGDPHAHQEIPKVTLPKNDTSDKFWAYTDPYCATVTRRDVAVLDSLIQEFAKEIDIKIPDIGEHYANNWTEDVIKEEPNLGKSSPKKSCNKTDSKKNGIHTMVESFSTPQTQRLLAALMEERILNALPKNGENGTKMSKIKISDLTRVKSTGQKVGTCLDRRLKKELVEQGILGLDDITKSVPEDEILKEIRKCQQELATVNEYNMEELNKLRRTVASDVHSNELKENLERIDNQVLNLYNMVIATFFQSQLEIDRQFETQTDGLLRQQVDLNREINGLTDMHMLY